MTGYASKLRNVQPCLPISVTMANGEVGTAVSQGTAHLVLATAAGGRALTLSNVLVVPGMTVSLFSVRRAAGRGYRTEFDASSVRIFKGARRVLAGVCAGALYVLREQR